ncbi:hypothetical protein BH11PSE12_BH11PSE12_20430 [soil metagenome]
MRHIRWAIRFLPLIENMAHKNKRPVGGSWRMDETYIKFKGIWKYLYRAVDKQGKTVFSADGKARHGRDGQERRQHGRLFSQIVLEMVFSYLYRHNEFREGVDMRCSTQRVAGAVALLLVIGALAGCSFGKMAVARAHSRDRFVPTQANSDVRYAPGSQDMAERAAMAISHSREIIEQTHAAKFPHVPQVFVCHTDCFTTFVPVSKEVTAAQFADAVFMNDEVLKLREQQRGMPVENFLTHELAHLLLYQHAGPIAYMRVPSWFREGIAVAVSNGAGAEACTPAEAAKNILAGKHFDPAEAGSLFRDRTASSYDLRTSIFYREAGLFVQYMRERNPMAFQMALKDILNGNDFQESFSHAYGQSISSQWPDFVASMNLLVAQQ